MAFEKIIGNERAKQTLSKMINSNKILNGYLFSGKEGIGKMLFAKEFAKMILCIEKENKPCNKCKSCIEFNRKQ